MSLFHRVEIGIGGTLALWSPYSSGFSIQNGPALLNVKGILFPLLRNPVPDSEFTFGLQLQQQLRIPRFDGLNDLDTESPLTALRAVADKPFWRMGVTASLGFFLTQGRTDSELSTALRIHLPWMSRATVQGFAVLQGLFGSKQSAPLRGGFGLSLHFAWDNGTSLSGGYMQGRGDGVAPNAIYIGGPDYHIGRETAAQSYSRPPIPNREMVPSPWPWIWEKLKEGWNEAELANEAHRRGADWLTDECFLYEEGNYDKPLRHLGKRDASGKFCKVGGSLVPMDEPLREVGPDLVPIRTPIQNQETPKPPSSPAIPTKQPAPTPAEPGTLSSRTKKHKPPHRETSSDRLAETPSSPNVPISTTPREIPNPAPTAAESSFGESAKQFARGFAKGVLEEGDNIYRDTKELPERLAKTGREIVEDVQAGRKLRALAPIEAIGHAIQTASHEDVERLAHGAVDSAIEWYHKPAQEKGESLGRATMSIAAEAAISALTDGLGTVAGLRKAEKAAEAAEHVRDAERAAQKSARVASHAEGTASEASELIRPASSAKQKELMGDHLRQQSKYGTPERLPDGRLRYKGDVKPARTTGEMSGQRVVREWNPETGQTRTWQETVDYEGRIRQVRPDESLTEGKKVHYKFDPDGKYQGKW